MIGPAPGLVGRDKITEALARLDIDRMLVGTVFAVPVLELAPEPMQMDRMFHHRVIDEHEAHAFVALEDNRLGFRELLAIEPPEKALHGAGEVQRDLARGRARILAGPFCAQIGVGEYAPPGRKAFAGSL